MGANFPSVPLRRTVRYRKEFVRINDFERYKRCRVQLHAKGIVLRDFVAGSEIKTKDQQICRAGDFLVAEIDAKVGGFGIVPKDLGGAIVSSHYFLFDVDETVLDRRFLDFFIRTPAFSDQVLAKGSTNYASIRPDDVLEYVIPLPSLDEQRRIVSRIEELAIKIDEALELRRLAAESVEMLIEVACRSLFKEISKTVPMTPLSSVATITGGNSLPKIPDGYPSNSEVLLVKVSDMNTPGNEVMLRSSSASVSKDSPFLQGIRIFGAGAVVFPKRGGAIATNKKRILTKPTALDPNLMAVSPLDTRLIDPPYLFWWFQGVDLASMQDGTSVPQINVVDLKPLLIPVPILEAQRRIVAYLDGLQAKANELEHMQADTAAELDALLPSILDKAFKGKL